MPTLTQTRSKTVPVIPSNSYDIEPDGVEDAEEYPPEFFEEMDRRFEEAKRQFANGEIKPMTVEEYAASKGIKLNG